MLPATFTILKNNAAIYYPAPNRRCLGATLPGQPPVCLLLILGVSLGIWLQPPSRSSPCLHSSAPGNSPTALFQAVFLHSGHFLSCCFSPHPWHSLLCCFSLHPARCPWDQNFPSPSSVGSSRAGAHSGKASCFPPSPGFLG